MCTYILYILILCTCLYPRILISLCVYLLVSSHLYIFISSVSCALAYIPASSYPQVHIWLLVNLVSSHPPILRLMYSVYVLVSVHFHILISLSPCNLGACWCWYPRILTSSYPHVPWFVFASSHPHIFSFGYTRWYPWILTSSLLSQVNVYLFATLHAHILRFVCACLYPCILTS